ncbi:MAG: D-2-hydroxyacid dehydrogenase [Phycisphaeraceae bacterium]
MSRHIVVLDGHTLTAAAPDETPAAGEPGWAPVAQYGELTVHPRLPESDVPDAARDAAIVLTNKVRLTAETIDALPNLEYIGVLATGTDIIDLDAARQRHITVTNAPAYGVPSVAQHTIALLLELTNRVATHSAAVHESAWASCPDFSFTLTPLVELADKTLGLVGFGDIGQRVARIGHSLGMNIAVHSRTQRDVDFPVQWMERDELFEAADVISLHCPLTDQTRGLVNAERLQRMKPTALLINTGRGPLVDEAALATALRDGDIAGAGLDVLSEEPPASGSPLIGAPNCFITPHNAWASQESRTRLMRIIADNIGAYLAGKPQNVVNP